jgi:hypothetical protein
MFLQLEEEFEDVLDEDLERAARAKEAAGTFVRRQIPTKTQVGQSYMSAEQKFSATGVTLRDFLVDKVNNPTYVPKSPVEAIEILRRQAEALPEGAKIAQLAMLDDPEIEFQMAEDFIVQRQIARAQALGSARTMFQGFEELPSTEQETLMQRAYQRTAEGFGSIQTLAIRSFESLNRNVVKPGFKRVEPYYEQVKEYTEPAREYAEEWYSENLGYSKFDIANMGIDIGLRAGVSYMAGGYAPVANVLYEYNAERIAQQKAKLQAHFINAVALNKRLNKYAVSTATWGLGDVVRPVPSVKDIFLTSLRDEELPAADVWITPEVQSRRADFEADIMRQLERRLERGESLSTEADPYGYERYMLKKLYNVDTSGMTGPEVRQALLSLETMTYEEKKRQRIFQQAPAIVVPTTSISSSDYWSFQVPESTITFERNEGFERRLDDPMNFTPRPENLAFAEPNLLTWRPSYARAENMIAPEDALELIVEEPTSEPFPRRRRTQAVQELTGSASVPLPRRRRRTSRNYSETTSFTNPDWDPGWS